MPATTPLRLDAQLVHDARSSAALMERSPTAQVEFWARLGRVAESVFSYDRIRTIKQMGQVQDLDSLIARVDTTEGRMLATAEIQRHGMPTYGTDPKHPGLIIERRPDGTTRVGKFVNRQFVEQGTKAGRGAAAAC